MTTPKSLRDIVYADFMDGADIYFQESGKVLYQYDNDAGMVYYIMIEFGLTGMALNPLTIVLVSLIVIVSGIVLTTVSSYFAVGRYLKMKTHDMYYV